MLVGVDEVRARTLRQSQPCERGTSSDRPAGTTARGMRSMRRTTRKPLVGNLNEQAPIVTGN